MSRKRHKTDDMKRLIKRVVIVLASAGFLLPLSSSAQTGAFDAMRPVGRETFEMMRGFFDYDRGVPLDVKIAGTTDWEGYVREKVVFSGVDPDSRVPGYLAVPQEGTAPYPCVFLIHGLNSSKESWWQFGGPMNELTRQLLAAGFAVMTLDTEYHGERLANNGFESPRSFAEKGWYTHFRDMVIQSVIEYRRALDYLTTRPEIDAGRIGVVGYSMGGTMAFNLTAMEPRIRTSVACVTPVSAAPMQPTAVQNSAPYITRQPFLMLMADKDEMNYTIQQAQRLYEMLATPTKDLVVFDSGHMLPREWVDPAMEWMQKYLK